MVEQREVRAHPERMRAAIVLRGVDPTRADLDRWLWLDEERRRTQSELEECNGEKKRLAQLGRTDPAAARARGQELRQRSRELDDALAEVTREWQSILDWFPNWPHPEMPPGEGAADNVEEAAWIPGSGYVDR